MSKDYSLHLRLSEKELEEVDASAEKNDMTRSNYIRWKLRNSPADAITDEQVQQVSASLLADYKKLAKELELVRYNLERIGRANTGLSWGEGSEDELKKQLEEANLSLKKLQETYINQPKKRINEKVENLERS